MNKFINRTKELEALEKQYNLPSSSLVIIYGRRRVGKTSLINEFLKSHQDSLYFLATEESERQNLNYFKMQVGNFIKNDLLKSASIDWMTTFKALIDYKTETKKIIVFDEFQYIGKDNNAFPSIMQKIWDTFLSSSNIMLILCGSLISLMKSQTLDYSSPLYGRRTAQIKLGQIPFKNYHEFFDVSPTLDLVPFYAVTGGIPKYINAFIGYKDIYKAIKENILSKESFLYEEPYFLLQKEVSEIGSYFSLIKSIAMGKHKLNEIAADLGLKQTGLTKYLKVLMDLDLIDREVPITESAPQKSKKGLYRIKDNFIAFWFKFVYIYRSYLEKGEVDYVLSQIKKGFIQNYVSYIYEDVCREKMWELSSQNIWDFPIDKVGRYWGKETGEIDIVAIDTIGKNLILGEAKYTKSPKGIEVLNKLKSKAEVMKKLTNTSNVYYIIFSTSGYKEDLIKAVKEDKTIYLCS